MLSAGSPAPHVRVKQVLLSYLSYQEDVGRFWKGPPNLKHTRACRGRNLGLGGRILVWCFLAEPCCVGR